MMNRPEDPSSPLHFLGPGECPLSLCCDAPEVEELKFHGFCSRCHDHATFYVVGPKDEVLELCPNCNGDPRGYLPLINCTHCDLTGLVI